MSDPIIAVENLSKRYRLRHEYERQRYVALRDVIAAKFTAPVRWLGSRYGRHNSLARHAGAGGRATHEEFWALKHVSFRVRPGDVVGIVGRNGAGKSTLLKILSRITEPTGGRVMLGGRVASLLEVGTGFHPELTGRENIILNGAILGMRRAEIRRKFDEIVDFAGVERFLDTPVKRYSSGMYVRLAFAVAAHLEPEILLIDEVLAVGDAQFQKKCLGRMSAVAASGRTVLFVSHNMNAVESLCTHAICLENGSVREQGADVRAILARYLAASGGNETAASIWRNENDAFNHPVLQPLCFAVVDVTGEPLRAPVRNDEQLHVLIRADVRQLDPGLNAGFALFNQESEQLLWSLTTDGPEESWPKLELGIVELRCRLPKRLLNEGAYRLEMIASLHCRDWIVRPGANSPVLHFEIRGGLSDSPYWTFARPGILAPEWKWERAR